MDTEQTWIEIRKHTAGKRIAVLTNRNDKPLKKTLEGLLDAQIRWVLTKPRQIDALAKSVKVGTYYMVLAFTGWMHHKDGAAISAAAQRSGTLYIRANKGRPTTICLALARDLGLD